jgi:hypothetical protein
MQWIFMLVGLLLGGLVGESIGAAIVAGLLALSLAQAFKLHALQQQSTALAAQLKDFAERFERRSAEFHERLRKLEPGQSDAASP